MALDVIEEWALAPGQALSFQQTLDRRLVHRAAVAEVFLTDAQALDDQRVVLGAQLPPCHGYFSDHAHVAEGVDPMLLMEVGRQATLASAHTLGVADDVVLISDEFDLRVLDPAAWRAAGATARIRLDSSFTWTRIRRGRPRAGVCEQQLYVDGALAAVHSSSGQLLSREELELLRTVQRDSAPPWTADLVDRPDPEAVAPELVGRRDPRNVVLAAPRRDVDAGALVARVAPRWSNRALFDHSYDHLTMQVLTEAARQLALLAVGERSASGLRDWQVVGLHGRFTRFAELDAVVTVSATGAPAPGEDGDVDVRVLVDGEEIAVLTVAVATRRG